MAQRRKINRLQTYDYSSPGVYFITICTQNRKNLFWHSPEAVPCRPEEVQLSPWGSLVKEAIENIPPHYPAVSVDHFAIMPNHVHLLLRILSDPAGQPMAAPGVSRVVQQLKGSVSKGAGVSLWQKGFYDHVIRTEQSYLEIWNYIEGNPMKWEEDQLFSRSSTKRSDAP